MSAERAAALQEQAWSLQAEGKLEDALTAGREALRLMEESEGPDSPEVANLLNDLAEIEQDRQEFRSALALAGRAQEIEDRLGDAFTGEGAVPIRVKTLSLLGAIRGIRGDYALGERDLQQALAIAAAERWLAARG